MLFLKYGPQYSLYSFLVLEVAKPLKVKEFNLVIAYIDTHMVLYSTSEKLFFPYPNISERKRLLSKIFSKFLALMIFPPNTLHKEVGTDGSLLGLCKIQSWSSPIPWSPPPFLYKHSGFNRVLGNVSSIYHLQMWNL